MLEVVDCKIPSIIFCSKRHHMDAQTNGAEKQRDPDISVEIAALQKEQMDVLKQIDVIKKSPKKDSKLQRKLKELEERDKSLSQVLVEKRSRLLDVYKNLKLKQQEKRNRITRSIHFIFNCFPFLFVRY
jgi:hypothetical protein